MGRISFVILILVLAAAALAPCLQAATIRVPDDAKTIQAAIENASDGDEVLVAPAEYRERINFLGKAIRVRSDEGPEKTIIAAPPFISIDGKGSIVFFRSGETREAILEGFTITEGTGTLIEDIGTGQSACAGGGILVSDGSSPTIRGNVIRKNAAEATGEAFGAGGGIAILEESHPILEDNEIGDNAAQAGGGIAIVLRSNPTLSRDRILANEAEYGGGIFVAEASGPILQENEVRGNRAAWGAGIYIQSVPTDPTGIAAPTTVAEGNDILGNEATVAGGGMCLYWAEARIARCRIERNVASSDPFGDGWGGAIYTESSTARIASCALIENRAYSGAGIYIQGSVSSVTIEHATIFQNRGSVGGGICMYPDPVEGTMIINSILWENEAWYEDLPNLYGVDVSMVQTCDLSDGLYEGTNGNFMADPRFLDPEDGDIHLAKGSPCIDRAQPVLTAAEEFDLDGDPRAVDGDGDGKIIADVGADEYIPPGNPFIRGHCNQTPGIDLSDPVFLLNYLFADGPAPGCADACDANDDGQLDLGDPVYSLSYLFADGPDPLPPFPDCGVDVTVDDLDCATFPSCP